MRVNQKEEVAVTLRKWTFAVLSGWLGVSQAGYGQEANRLPIPSPPAGMMPSEPMAQAIARRLRESGQLSNYRVNVAVQNGVVDLTGEVTDENQRQAAVAIARAMTGVQVVRDWLQVRPDSGVMQTQLAVPPQLGPGPVGQKPGERIDGQLPEPMPIFQAPVGPNPAMQPPPMPPYAWPTYAPYNNYSRVAYPTSYAYDQFPFIGPMYPFPRVPLGWRSVSLTWEDGNWYFHRSPSGHDWWRIRYH
jgi:BON domain-containing protein